MARSAVKALQSRPRATNTNKDVKLSRPTYAQLVFKAVAQLARTMAGGPGRIEFENIITLLAMYLEQLGMSAPKDIEKMCRQALSKWIDKKYIATHGDITSDGFVFTMDGRGVDLSIRVKLLKKGRRSSKRSLVAYCRNVAVFTGPTERMTGDAKTQKIARLERQVRSLEAGLPPTQPSTWGASLATIPDTNEDVEMEDDGSETEREEQVHEDPRGSVVEEPVQLDRVHDPAKHVSLRANFPSAASSGSTVAARSYPSPTSPEDGRAGTDGSPPTPCPRSRLLLSNRSFVSDHHHDEAAGPSSRHFFSAASSSSGSSGGRRDARVVDEADNVFQSFGSPVPLQHEDTFDFTDEIQAHHTRQLRTRDTRLEELQAKYNATRRELTALEERYESEVTKRALCEDNIETLQKKVQALERSRSQYAESYRKLRGQLEQERDVGMQNRRALRCKIQALEEKQRHLNDEISTLRQSEATMRKRLVDTIAALRISDELLHNMKKLVDELQSKVRELEGKGKDLEYERHQRRMAAWRLKTKQREVEILQKRVDEVETSDKEKKLLLRETEKILAAEKRATAELTKEVKKRDGAIATLQGYLVNHLNNATNLVTTLYNRS
ncbi:unnamed protein product [Somion occarium]|uniref:Uncharacterized protein n=1 Tax=Somion occarium TaxID=3059160 RepID=A0ABP1E3J0_9APHY